MVATASQISYLPKPLIKENISNPKLMLTTIINEKIKTQLKL